MEEFIIKNNPGDFDCPPISGQDTFFEYLVNEEGKWEHWNNRVYISLLILKFL